MFINFINYNINVTKLKRLSMAINKTFNTDNKMQ